MAESDAGRLRKRPGGSKFDALKNLRNRGEKNKFDVADQIEQVWDEVDELEYSKRVQERQNDDFIVDDDGHGYLDHGREVFDDEGDSDDENGTTSVDRRKQKNQSTANKGGTAGGIKRFLAVGRQKQDDKAVQLTDANEDLDALMAALHSQVSSQSSTVPKTAAPSVRNYRSGLVALAGTYGPAATTFSPENSPSKPAPSKIPKQSTSPFKSQKIVPKMRLDQPVVDDFSANELLDILDSEDGEMDVSTPHEEVGSLAPEPMKELPMDVKPKLEMLTLESSSNGILFQKNGCLMPETSKSGFTSADLDLPLVENSEGYLVLRMYWLDIYEDTIKHPGTLYLFGKVWHDEAREHISCCVVVKDVERCMFLLPKPEVTPMECYNDIAQHMAQRKIDPFRFKPNIDRMYAFGDTNVPRDEHSYCVLRYKATWPALPADFQSETVSKVLHSSFTCTELLLLERHLRGPCWIEVLQPVASSPGVTWCKIEATCNGVDSISVVEGDLVPPFRVLTLDFKSSVLAQKHENQITCVSALYHDTLALDACKAQTLVASAKHFAALAPTGGLAFPFDLREALQKKSPTTVEVCANERSLLGFLVAKIQKLDPDIIVGHDLQHYWLDLLVQRIAATKVQAWSRVSRLKRQAAIPKAGHSKAVLLECFAGRLICDVGVCARELIRCQSYDLTQLALEQLKEKRYEVTTELLPQFFGTSAGVIDLIRLSLTDASYSLRLMSDLNALPLSLNITQLVGGLWSRTLLGGRSERNEFLLLHAFYDRGYLCPERVNFKNRKIPAASRETGENEEDPEAEGAAAVGKKKAAYAGGLVLDPKKGFYESFILLLDFNSLYPSIIQEFNICFTTIPVHETNAEPPDPKVEFGVLPQEIKKLVESRRQVKQLMKQPNLSPEVYAQYNIRQLALKLTANSMYGCLGFAHSRFYAQPLAALITAKGREILMHTKLTVEKSGLEVIYGDTDSLMINTRSSTFDDVIAMGKKVKAEVNRSYKQLELDIDGVFSRMLLLKKKKYAAMKVEKEPNGSLKQHAEMKGLDIVRRDWSGIAKEAGNLVLQDILTAESSDSMVEKIHSHLEELGMRLKDGMVALEQFEIHKQLTKAPQDYADAKALPHVTVAQRLNLKCGRQLRQGDTVSYVICKDGTTNAATQRAYHIDELAKNDQLAIDVDYYLTQQVHPVVSRLCEPIDGTDASRIAECLGLDPTSYRAKLQQVKEGDSGDMLGVLKISAGNGDPFKAQCPVCKTELCFVEEDGRSADIEKCSNPSCTFEPASQTYWLTNQLQQKLHYYVQQYYKGWLICDDAVCGLRMRRLPFRFDRSGAPMCPACEVHTMRLEVKESDLFQQLFYLQKKFETGEKAAKISPTDVRNAYRELHKIVTHWISRNAFSQVNLSSLFANVVRLSR